MKEYDMTVWSFGETLHRINMEHGPNYATAACRLVASCGRMTVSWHTYPLHLALPPNHSDSMAHSCRNKHHGIQWSFILNKFDYGRIDLTAFYQADSGNL